MKRLAFIAGLILSSALSIGTASATPFPQSAAIENLCANPELQDNLAVRATCLSYFEGEYRVNKATEILCANTSIEGMLSVRNLCKGYYGNAWPANPAIVSMCKDPANLSNKAVLTICKNYNNP